MSRATPRGDAPAGGPPSPGDADLGAGQVRALIADGVAEPLLAGCRVVPVFYRQRWWHLPAGGDRYRPAPPEVAAFLDARRERLHAACRALSDQSPR